MDEVAINYCKAMIIAGHSVNREIYVLIFFKVNVDFIQKLNKSTCKMAWIYDPRHKSSRECIELPTVKLSSC